MKRIALTSLLIVGLLFVGSHAFAWFGHGSMGSRGGDCSSRMSDEQRQQRHDQHFERMGVVLDLTDEQKQQLQTLHQQRQEQQQQLREQMQASRDKMREAGRTDNFNEEEFRATAQQHADLKTQMMVEMAKSRQQMASILTPEQLEKAEQLKEMRGERCGNYGEGKEHGRFHKQGKGSCFSS